MTINQTSSTFSKAAHELSPGGKPVDWVTGPVNVVLFDNGTIDVYSGKDSQALTIDTRSGLLAFNGKTTPMQWSEDVEPFFGRADKTVAFGKKLSSPELDVSITGRSVFVGIGSTRDSGVLIQEIGSGMKGVAVYSEAKGKSVLSGVVDTAPSAPAMKRVLDPDMSVIPFASI